MNTKQIASLIFIIFLSFPSFSNNTLESYKTAKMDTRIFKIPPKIEQLTFKNPKQNLVKLVTYICKNKKNDFQKVKIIYDWICENIRYDINSYYNNSTTYEEEPYITTIKNKMSVCEGYADVFSKMCELANIESIKITGYARGLGFDPFNEKRKLNSNHKWNAVKIDNKWYIIDTTWGSGHIKDNNFFKHYTSFFLFANPTELIYTHFPDKKIKQFIVDSYSKKKFLNQIYLNSLFFESKIKLKNKLQNWQSLKKDELELEFIVPEGKSITAIIKSRTGNTNNKNIFIQKNKKSHKIKLRFPKKGEYLVQFYTGKESIPQKDFCGEFIIKVNKGNRNLFPIQFNDYFSYRCKLYYPNNYYIKKGKNTRFKISIPEATEATIISGDTRIKMAKEKDIFTSNVTIQKRNSLIIFAKFKNKVDYIGILEYKIGK